ncbi:MAG: exodeoxyribonuclease VII large subunit [Acidobacteriota bacterium]|nr:exodeoxyribonuclease VII large subunit [Acidobacteriota bacterium]MDE3106781.1 exodeoxyribonuclease VII large subunit [Acidobacteriota bacterium]
MSETESAARVVLNVGEFYELVTGHLEAAFGRRRPQWVRGEVAKVYEKTHLYLDLVDAGSASDTRRPVLNAHCWATAWGPLKRRLASEGVTLTPGTVVGLLGYVDVYAPQGKIGFTVTEIDVEGLLGDLARRRLELIARLEREGLLERNKNRPAPVVPLRVGLVASPGTEGFNDFVGQLTRSGFSFDVAVVTTLVQGDGAPEQIVRALERLDEADRDVICVVRGGGSKGDLACFDDERVARAIAQCATPVFTGIGHTGDESVADLVAFARAITPTKLGEEIVAMVAQWHARHVRQSAQTLARFANDLLEESLEYLRERRRTVVFALRDRLRAETRHLATQRQRLLRDARQLLEVNATWLTSARQLLSAYDPQRRLAQGWSMVTTASGTLVRSSDDVVEGTNLVIRVSDGLVTGVVTGKEAL